MADQDRSSEYTSTRAQAQRRQDRVRSAHMTLHTHLQVSWHELLVLNLRARMRWACEDHYWCWFVPWQRGEVVAKSIHYSLSPWQKQSVFLAVFRSQNWVPKFVLNLCRICVEIGTCVRPHWWVAELGSRRMKKDSCTHIYWSHAICCMHFACGMQMAPWPIPCGTPTKTNNLFNTKLLQKLQNCYKHNKNVWNPYKNRLEKNKSS